MYKFVNKKTKVIVWVLDVLGFFVWALAHVFSPRKILGKMPVPDKPKKILLIRADYIGDVLLTTQTLEAIRKRFPEAHISFLVSSKAREILEDNPYIDNIIAYDPPWFFKKGLKAAFREYLNMVSVLRQNHFDLAADFRGDARNILLLMVFGGIPHRVSFAASGGWYLLTAVAKYEKSLHEAQYHSVIAGQLGARITSGALPELYIGERDRAAVRRFLIRYGLKDADMLVVVQPGARRAVREWPEDRYCEVCRYLIDVYKAKIILTGAPEDLPRTKRLRDLLDGRAVVASGELGTLKELAALFELSSLYLGVSSGPSHIAAALRLPSVLIFGPESVSQWRPLGNRHIIVKKDFPCCPCNQKGCRLEENCIRSVTSEDVISAVNALMEDLKETAALEKCNYGTI